MRILLYIHVLSPGSRADGKKNRWGIVVECIRGRSERKGRIACCFGGVGLVGKRNGEEEDAHCLGQSDPLRPWNYGEISSPSGRNERFQSILPLWAGPESRLKGRYRCCWRWLLGNCEVFSFYASWLPLLRSFVAPFLFFFLPVSFSLASLIDQI